MGKHAMRTQLLRSLPPARWVFLLFACLLALAVAGSAGAQPWGGVNGFSVTQVSHAQQGQFQQVGQGQWQETSDAGGDGFRFQETGRDEWSVYLLDSSRNVRIQLDLYRNLVLYGDDSSPEMRPLYGIVGVRGDAGSSAAAPPEPEAPPPPPPPQPEPQQAPLNANGLSVTRVAYGVNGEATGEIRQIGAGEWEERGDSGGRAHFRETGRDEWSVYLDDSSRGVRLQLDLHRRLVLYGAGNSPEMGPLYGISSASADPVAISAVNPPTPQPYQEPTRPVDQGGGGGNSAIEKEFCWKDSYPRGAGTVPQACPAGRDRIGLLCYTACPANSRRFGFDCHSVCPPDMRDDGLYCRSSEYARTPYVASPGDLFGPSNRQRCESAHGSCEKAVGDAVGTIFYERCKAGYSSWPAGICRPPQPNCAALGPGHQLDLASEKQVLTGDPVTGSCGSGQSENAGLCYQQCQSGYTGVGPVCWTGAPRGWVECGMGAAKDSFTCGQIVFDQVSSVGQVAFNIATLPTGAGVASAAASSASKAARLAELKRMYQTLKSLYRENETAIRALAASKRAAGAIVDDVQLIDDDVVTEEDIVRIAAEIAAIADPTGVAGTVAAYTYPKCSKYNF